MKRTIFAMRLCLVTLVAAGLVLSASAVFAKEDKPVPPSEKLRALIKKQPEIGSLLRASIKAAKKVNPDIVTNPAQTYEEYCKWVDWLWQWAPGDCPRGILLQKICYFYFLVDQPLEELKDKNLYKPALQYYPPFSKWLHNFAVSWGDFLNTERSWSLEQFKEFYADKVFGLQNDWYEDPKNWKTFNQFFSRRLKNQDKRPIACPKDPSVVVSPADSVPQGADLAEGFWPIDADSKIEVDGGLKVKHVTYYSVNDLLSKDSKYKGAFANGALTHTFLNVFDYHRYHFAVGGIIKEIAPKIVQNVALEVTWSPKKREYVPVDSTGWQFTQTRGYVIVDTEKYGLVALIPMGMAHVSSVNFEKDVLEGKGKRFEKGRPLGYFLFGGSDFVMLFQKEAGLNVTVKTERNPVTNTLEYEHILACDEYGVMMGQPKSK